MARITIDRSHHLSHAKAKGLAERLAKDLEERFELSWAWEGDEVHFERPGIAGHMHVGRTSIRLDVKLGLLLSPLRPAIEREIHSQLDQLTGPSKRA